MKKYIVTLSLLTAIFFSCENVVEVDMQMQDPRMVINGFINPDSSFAIHLSKSKYILDNAPLRDVTDARVSLYEGDKKLGDLVHVENGQYRLDDVFPQAGSTYTLRATHEGFETISATEKVLTFTEPIAVMAEKVISKNEYEQKYRFSFSLQDPAGERNFYLFQAVEKISGKNYNHDGELIHEFSYTNSLRLESPDPSLEENCVNSCALLLNDTYFDGRSYEVQLNGSSWGWGDNADVERELYLSAFRISEAAYLYYKTLDKSYEAGGNPFSEPVKVFSNVEGGFGIWASVAGKTVKIDM